MPGFSFGMDRKSGLGFARYATGCLQLSPCQALIETRREIAQCGNKARIKLSVVTVDRGKFTLYKPGWQG